MKKYILTLLFLLQTTYATDIYKAIVDGKINNKYVLYFVVSENCPNCKSYMNNIAAHKPLSSFIKQNFQVGLTDLASGDLLARDIPFKGTVPSTFIIAPNGQISEAMEGELNTQELYIYLQKIQRLLK